MKYLKSLRLDQKILGVYLFIRFPALGMTCVLPFLGVASVLHSLTSGHILGFLIVSTSFHVFAYVFNDVIDLPIDKTEPLRAKYPLVTGVIKPKIALAIAFAQIPLSFLITAILKANSYSYVTKV